MAEIRLVAEPRTEEGSSASRRLRRAGRVPGVLYGHGSGPRSLSVDARELRAALTGGGSNALFDLVLDGERHLAMARQLQQHPIRRTVAHVDFQLVSRDEVIQAEVPIVLVGDPVEVSRAGGTVEHVLPSLSVHAKPAALPQAIEVDVANLSVGEPIRIADLALPAGVTADGDPDAVVVVAVLPHAPAAEEGEGEGEAAGEAAEASAEG